MTLTLTQWSGIYVCGDRFLTIWSGILMCGDRFLTIWSGIFMCGDLFFAFTMVKPHRTITKALMYNYIFSTGLQGNYKLVSFNIHSITKQSKITKISFRLNILPYSFFISNYNCWSVWLLLTNIHRISPNSHLWFDNYGFL